jgi:aryl-alcohol dehydrogenase-like predicted oxidoreductase
VEKRPLGKTGLEVSPVGLGTWAMGGHVPTWGHVDDNESIATIQQAIDLGLNLFDTAPIYGLGHSEELLGKAVSGRRDSLVLATKCGLLPPKRAGQMPPRCLSYDSVLSECEASLRRLRTDRIDLYQCHWPDPETPIRDTMRALTTLQRQGKIRAIGLSNFSYEQVAAASEYGPIHCLQPPLSMLQRRSTEDLIPYCQEHNIAVITYSPLCKGLLTGKFSEDSSFDDIRAKDPEFVGDRFRQNLRTVERLRTIAQRLGKTISQLAVNWAANHPGVTSSILGAKRPSQLTENAGGIGWALSDDDRGEIDAILGEGGS